MTSIRLALALSFAERYLLIIIGLGSNIAIARILTPESIGIYSVSLAVIGIAQVLRDLGISSYIIQEQELTEARIRTAFGITLVLGCILFIIVFILAPLIGKIYSEPSMVLTLRICALNFLTLPFCTVSLSLLKREMAFRALLIVNLIAATIGAAISVGLALSGLGVVSLAIGSVALNLVTGTGAWFARRGSRLLLPSLSEWRRLVNFGAQSSFAGVITSVSMDINDLAVGKVMGFEPVAILSRAQGLMNLFHRDLMSAIRNVAYPAYAKSYREKISLEPIYITSVTHVTLIAWPFYGFVSLYPLEILRLMFGPQWDIAAPLVPIFCLAGALAATGNLIASLILAAGRVDLVTKVELIFQPFRAAIIVFAAFIFESMSACAIALTTALLVQIPLLYYYKGKCIQNDFKSLLKNLRLSLFVAVTTLLSPFLISVYFSLSRTETINPVIFAAAIFCSAVIWLVALIKFKHPLSYDPAFRQLMSRFSLNIK